MRSKRRGYNEFSRLLSRALGASSKPAAVIHHAALQKALASDLETVFGLIPDHFYAPPDALSVALRRIEELQAKLDQIEAILTK